MVSSSGTFRVICLHDSNQNVPAYPSHSEGLAEERLLDDALWCLDVHVVTGYLPLAFLNTGTIVNIDPFEQPLQ